jgi:NAD(P)H-nitrite reductase large subunit
MLSRIVIVGAGQAATQAATSLRAGGYDGQLVLLGNEGLLPYQRPPLSKAYLSGAMGLDRVILKPLEAWAEDKVEVHLDAARACARCPVQGQTLPACIICAALQTPTVWAKSWGPGSDWL